MGIIEKINIADRMLKDLFENVSIKESSSREFMNHFILELSGYKQKRSGISPKIILPKSTLESNSIKWFYYTDPRSTENIIERTSMSIESMCVDIDDIIKKSRFDSAYLESIAVDTLPLYNYEIVEGGERVVTISETSIKEYLEKKGLVLKSIDENDSSPKGTIGGEFVTGEYSKTITINFDSLEYDGRVSPEKSIDISNYFEERHNIPEKVDISAHVNGLRIIVDIHGYTDDLTLVEVSK